MSSTATAVQSPPAARDQTRLAGYLAEFETPEQLRAAAAKVRDAGYTRWDTHAPFPVHGIDPAMGIRPTILPWIVFVVGAAGTATGILLQWYTNATSYQDFPWIPTFVQGYNFLVSGKPFWSFPANIPVIFELTVLFAAFAAFFGMLVLNDLPKFYNPIFNCERFRRATDDRFFLSIESADPRFDRAGTRKLLESLGGTAVEEYRDRVYHAPTPKPLLQAAVVAALLAVIPLCIVWKARYATSPSPRIHIIQDMDNQEKFKTQKANAIFLDGRAMRAPVGATQDNPLGLTVARGDLKEDAHFYRGLIGGQYADRFPVHHEGVAIDEKFLARGQRQFNIYCAPCHGLDGAGNGPVNRRALELSNAGTSTWVQAASLHDAERLSRPVGHLFNTITNGIRTMPPYGNQINEMDRWAIVAYIKALQKTTAAKIEELPADIQAELRKR